MAVNNNINYNYNSGGATKAPKVAQTPAEKTSRNGADGGSSVQTESAGEYKDPAKHNERESVAQQALAKYMNDISAAPSTDSRKSNKIRLVSTVVAQETGIINTGTDQITFDLSPEISESKTVIYAEIGDIRQAASILIYGGSPSRKWSINAKFVSRTKEEAGITWKSIQLLRSWTNPDSNYKYGFDTGTPQVLRLYGYGQTWKGIPVVVSSLNIEYPTDVDYIPDENGTNVPIVMSASIQLTEARTVDDLLKRFNLEEFKLGVLKEW